MATAQVFVDGSPSSSYRLAQSGTAIARLSRVTKNYGSVQALKEVDFTVRAGEVVALLGPNGAGKSTVVRLLLGLASPTSGRASVFGGDPKDPASGFV